MLHPEQLLKLPGEDSGGWRKEDKTQKCRKLRSGVAPVSQRRKALPKDSDVFIYTLSQRLITGETPLLMGEGSCLTSCLSGLPQAPVFWDWHCVSPTCVTMPSSAMPHTPRLFQCSWKTSSLQTQFMSSEVGSSFVTNLFLITLGLI